MPDIATIVLLYIHFRNECLSVPRNENDADERLQRSREVHDSHMLALLMRDTTLSLVLKWKLVEMIQSN